MGRIGWQGSTVVGGWRPRLRRLGGVAAGGNPALSRKADAAARQAAERAVAYTLGRLVTEWAEDRSGDRRRSYLYEAEHCLKRNLPEWLERPASAIDPAEVIRELDRLKRAKGVYTANRTLAYGRAAYSCAVRRQVLKENPFRGIERPGREPTRERVLEAPELGAIWRACNKLNPTYAAFVRVLMLTLQRRGEVAAMEWSELSPDLTTWTLPASRTKNGRSHVVHLATSVRDIIQSLPRIRSNPHVLRPHANKGMSRSTTASRVRSRQR